MATTGDTAMTYQMRARSIAKGIRKARTQPIGEGFSQATGLLRIVCSFDEETFQQIRARAVKQETSFAEQVRQLVEWGLEA